MKALDTNVLARFYAKDDPAQSEIAFRIMAEEPSLFVTKTVVLELFWVLNKSPAYKMPPEIVHSVIRHLISMRNIMVEDYESVERALEWSELGLEFPDALHLAASQNCSEFLTFDRKRFAEVVSKLEGITKPRCTVPE